jgi:hypothetical protein
MLNLLSNTRPAREEICLVWAEREEKLFLSSVHDKLLTVDSRCRSRFERTNLCYVEMNLGRDDLQVHVNACFHAKAKAAIQNRERVLRQFTLHTLHFTAFRHRHGRSCCAGEPVRQERAAPIRTRESISLASLASCLVSQSTGSRCKG